MCPTPLHHTAPSRIPLPWPPFLVHWATAPTCQRHQNRPPLASSACPRRAPAARPPHFPQRFRRQPLPNVRPQLRSTRECKERGGSPQLFQAHRRSPRHRTSAPAFSTFLCLVRQSPCLLRSTGPLSQTWSRTLSSQRIAQPAVSTKIPTKSPTKSCARRAFGAYARQRWGVPPAAIFPRDVQARRAGIFIGITRPEYSSSVGAASSGARRGSAHARRRGVAAT